jgi:hypothetical protein
LTGHVRAALRRQDVDAILFETVYDHAPQGGVVLDDEDAHLSIAARA